MEKVFVSIFNRYHTVMPRLRSILSLVLVLITTLLVSCGSPQASKIPTTYTAQKIEQLQVYVQPIEAAREKMATLQALISDKNWVDVDTFIHGPLGQLRKDMLGLSRNLLVKDQKRAADLAKEVFGHLERLDGAAKDRNASAAVANFRSALDDFDAFLSLIPKA
jgi:photosystem II protein PsbQ